MSARGPALALLVSALACERGAGNAPGTPVGSASAHGMEPALPLPSTGAPALAEPLWARALAPVAPPASAGATVWATPPVRGSEMAEPAVYRLESAHEARAVLVDKMGQRVEDVPGAVIHATGERARLRVGELALCYAWATSAVLCRIAKLAARREIEAAYDWAGTTRVAAVDHAEPAPASVRPMAFVGFPKAGALSFGQVVALADEQGWVRTSSGHIEIVRRDVLRPIAVAVQPLRVGDAVHAYLWATGFAPATVSRVLEPGLRYAVRPRTLGPEQEHFFTALVKAAPDGTMR